MSVSSFDIAEGVKGSFICNSRFSTTLLSYNFYLPLDKTTMARNALLPYLLSSCCEKYRDYIDLNIRLLELYGADLSCSCNKCGDLFHIRFAISVINRELALGDDPVTDAADLLSSMIFAPAVKDGAFYEEDLTREKRKSIERIEGEINNKRSYARTRLLSEMFGDDPYGKFKYGTVEEVNALTTHSLYDAWQILLRTAQVQINVVGKTLPEGSFSRAKEEFSKIERYSLTDLTYENPLAEANSVKDITERFDVTQGKLVMGFTSAVRGDLKTSAALTLCADIFGGGPYSKLFTNVREKQSLCYYCSASARRSKGFMTVDSGIEESNADKVISAVLCELKDMQNGNFDDDVIEASKKSITDALHAYYDSSAALDLWYSREIYEHYSPNEAAEIISAVSKEDIIKAAKGLKLHTVYRLLPKKED